MNQKRNRYHLKVGAAGGRSLQGPTDEELAQTIQDLPGGSDSYVVFSKSSNSYMQAVGSFDEKFNLEFQEYSTDGHWEHPDEDVSGAEVVRLFLDYANEGTEWRDSIEWKRMDVDTGNCGGQKASSEVYPSTWKEIAKDTLKIFFKELGK